jgi:hypothetical protein
MGLPIPAFQSTTYPSEIASAFQLIDDHDHTAGKGAPILGSGTVTTLTGLAFVPVVGQQIYFKESTLTWELGRADADATLSIATIIKVISTSSALATHSGSIPTIAHGFIVGKIYYQSPTVIGGVTDVEPTNPDYYNRPCFQAIDATTLFVLNSLRPIKVSDTGIATVTTSTGSTDAGKVPKLDVNGGIDPSFMLYKPTIIFSKTVTTTVSVGPPASIPYDSVATTLTATNYFTTSLTGNHLTCLKACRVLASVYQGLQANWNSGSLLSADLWIYKNTIFNMQARGVYLFTTIATGAYSIGPSTSTWVDMTIGDTLVFAYDFTNETGGQQVNGSADFKARVVIL